MLSLLLKTKMAAIIWRRLSAKSKSLNPLLSANCFCVATSNSRFAGSLHSHRLSDLNLQKPDILSLIKLSGGSASTYNYNHGLRFFSISTPDDGSNPIEDPKPPSESKKTLEDFKHQEIEGPTVERDVSPLANETREVTERLMKSIYGVSNVLGVMGLVQLGLGAWISYTTRSAPVAEMTLMSAVAFGFPFSMALILRQTIKPMHFFKKMEELGRLQILTSTMQIAKHTNLFFVRLRGVSYLCIACLSAGTLLLVFFAR